MAQAGSRFTPLDGTGENASPSGQKKKKKKRKPSKGQRKRDSSSKPEQRNGIEEEVEMVGSSPVTESDATRTKEDGTDEEYLTADEGTSNLCVAQSAEAANLTTQSSLLQQLSQNHIGPDKAESRKRGKSRTVTSREPQQRVSHEKETRDNAMRGSEPLAPGVKVGSDPFMLFDNHNRLVKKFLDLLESGGEQTHLDFKASFFSCDPKITTEDSVKSSVKEDNRFLTDLMAMYNADEVPFKSVSGDEEASFLIYGISWTKTEKKSTSFKPTDQIRDQSDIQNLVMCRLVPEVTVRQYEVKLDLKTIEKRRRKRLDFLEQSDWDSHQTYHMVEIIHNRTKGPLLARHVTDKKNRGERNQIAEYLFTRTQATNRKLDWNRKKDREAIRAIYEKFDPGFGNYAGSLKRISDIARKTSRCSKDVEDLLWSLRVLILPPQQFQKKEDLDCLADIFDRFGWNIVLDFDHKSRSHGFCSKMKKVQQKTCDIVNYKDIATTDSRRLLNLEDVRRGKHFIYLQVKGDVTIKVDEPEKFPFSDVCFLFSEIFKKWDSTVDLEIFALSSSNECYYNAAELISRLETQWDEQLDNETSIVQCRVFSLSPHQTTLVKRTDKDSDWYYGLGTFDELTTMLKDISKYSDSDDQTEIRIPSSNNQDNGVTISENQRVAIEKAFTIYHINMGQPGSIDPNNNDKLINEARTEFLRGFELNQQALFVHENYGRVYGDRTITKNVITRLTHKLSTLERCKAPQTKGGEENLINIKHEASAGGTTVGRTILWNLRKQWPCLELMSLKEETWASVEDALRIIYFEKSHKPLCILVDQSTVGSMKTRDNVWELFLQKARTVSEGNDCLDLVVLFVEQVSNLPLVPDIGNTFDLSTRLDQREMEDFDALYQKAKKHLLETPHKTVALYGICQFDQSYGRINSVLENLQNCSPVQKRILILSSVLYKYAGVPVSVSLLAKELQSGSKTKSPAKLLGYLGNAKDVLLIPHPTKIMDWKLCGLRPPSKFVAGKLLQAHLFRHPLQKFLTIFLDLVETSLPISNAIDALVYPIFIQRWKYFDQDHNITTRELFSTFISDLEDELDAINPSARIAPFLTAEKLKPLIEKLAECNIHEGPHCRAMFARYLCLKCDDKDGALEEMRRALYVPKEAPMSSTRSDQVALLITAGFLLRMKMESMKGRDDFQASVQSLIIDGIEILERAQEKGSVAAYNVEAKLRLCYIKNYFEYNCNKNCVQFSEMLNAESDPYVNGAVAIIWKKLNDMDQLMHEKYFESSDDFGQKQSLEVKAAILGMVVDLSGSNASRLLSEAANINDENLTKCMVAFIMKEKDMPFESFSNQEMGNIVTSYRARIRNLEREHYRNGILAQVYIYNRTPPRLLLPMEESGSTGNSGLAKLFAETWAEKFPSDRRAIYIMAALNLATALSQTPESSEAKREFFMDEFWNTYHKFMEVSRDDRSDRAGKMEDSRKKKVLRREISFLFQKSDAPLGVLVPKGINFSLKSRFSSYLQFEGTPVSLNNPRDLLCKELGTKKNSRVVITLTIREFKRCRALGSNQPTYKFILGISPHGLVVERVCSVDGISTNNLDDSPR